MKEPSVLDYLKARLMPWRGKPPEIPPLETGLEGEGENQWVVSPKKVRPAGGSDAGEIKQPARAKAHLPLAVITSLVFALIAQRALEPPARSWGIAVTFYVFAAVGLGYAYWKKQVSFDSMPEVTLREEVSKVRLYALLLALPACVLAFLAFGGGVFDLTNLFFWMLGLFGFAFAFWSGRPGIIDWITAIPTKIFKQQWSLVFTRHHLLLASALALALFFRTYQLEPVPPEMVSDHAEKLLDVADVLNGETSIFFPRNTGREGFQMYLTAAVAFLFSSGLSFTSLKIGTLIAGLVALPFIYLLGKEVGNQRVGLIALTFVGIAYWPNVISRIGLRFALYPLFVAPTLYYLVRGLRTSNRNDFILAGLFLGLGLHGYSPFRVVPIVVVVAVLFYWLHTRSKEARLRTLLGLFVLAFIALIVFLPLLRYSLADPDIFSYRIMTRISGMEKPLDDSPWVIFIKNLWNALIMFAWDNGEVWVVSIPHRPALSATTGALFHLGLMLVVVRYMHRRHWLDLFLLTSIPLLMMPSILSLAFPTENPILNRTAGAIVPVFLIVGIALESILGAIRSALGSPWGSRVAWLIGISICFLASIQDYDLVFRQYQQQYRLSAWNTSQIGANIRAFSEIIGSPDSAWVVAYPHWVDTRLVGINAGFPLKDYAIWQEQFIETLGDPNSKLFIGKPEDVESLQALKILYPYGSLKEHHSPIEGKSFWMFFVPPIGETLTQQ